MCESNHRQLPKFNCAAPGDKQVAKKFSSILTDAKQSLEFEEECSCPFQEDDEESLGTKQMVYLVGNYLN